MIRSWILCASALALAAACDPSAKANRDDGPPPERLSKQHERCAASADCAEGLRCFADVCVATERSRLGDFYWALGERRHGAGEVDAAVEAYGLAVGQYEASEKLEVPPALYCDQGHALIAAEDPARLEQGARVLHKCFLAATPGSTLYRKALAGFAILIDNGLDPMLLAREDEATKYLTKGPRRPPTDDVRLTVASSSNTRAASHGALLAKLQAPDVRQSLLPCWEQNWKEGKEKTLTVTVPFEYKFVRGVYEEDDRYVLSLDGAAAPSSGTTPAAAQCVNSVVEPIVADFRGPGGTFKAKLTFTME